MSSLAGTIIVTGVAGGIGTGWLHAHLKSTQALTHFTIYIIHPSAPGNLKSILSLSAPPHHKYEIIPLDLSSPTHIKALTTSLTSRITSKELPQISLLLLIAGGMFLGPASTDQGVRFTSDGLELSYAVNYLANYLLITLLLPILSPTSARIIFIGSTSHNPAYASNAGAYHKPEMKIMFHDDFEALARGKVKIEKGDEFPASVRRYGGSKLCMTMLMYEMNRKFRLDPKRQHIHFLAYDPGVVGGTELTNSLPWYIRIVMQYMLVPIQTISVWIWRNGSLRTATVAGEDLEWCCWDESVQSGEYRNGRLVGESSPESMDQEKWGQLLEGTKAVIASLEEWE